MAVPSRIPMFLRLVGGNTASPFGGGLNPSPENDESKLSAHDFIAALQMWANGEITKADVVLQYNLTHADDSGDLNGLKGWFQAATKQEKFTDVVEWRLILARDKRGPAGIDLDGAFGYAVKGKFINGADAAHSLKNTGPQAARFNSWA